MHDKFICEECGHTSSKKVEKDKTYDCPVCGNTMRRAQKKEKSGGGSNKTLISDILYVIFAGGISFAIVYWISLWVPGWIGIILYIVWAIWFISSFVYFHKAMSGNPLKMPFQKKI